MRPVPIRKDDRHHEEVVHLLTDEEDWAIQCAIAANRPLLIRGEPGVGKTQLAHAAAVDLERPLVSYTVDSRTESRDLLWSFDAVQRLAEAQVLASVYASKDNSEDNSEDQLPELEARIAVQKFVRPGPLWWAFNWDSANNQNAGYESAPELPRGKKWKPADGVVVLIDEIDKGNSDVPNGLLEAFAMRQFKPPGCDPVTCSDSIQPPLIVVTTNEERMLPDPFLRRCIVLEMRLPDIGRADGENEFIKYLVARGTRHFASLQRDVVETAADFLLEDRRTAMEKDLTPLPGLAEYLDLLRAVANMKVKGKTAADLLNILRPYTFHKAKD